MLLNVSAILVGLVMLMWSANRFIVGASAVAKNLGVSPLIIGMTILGFGTSAPEMLVAAVASLNGNPGIAIGNAIGSNIANIALVLGIAALMLPIVVQSEIIRRELPVLILVMAVVFILLIDKALSRTDGIILLLGQCALIWWVIRLGLKTRNSKKIESGYNDEIPSNIPMPKAISFIVIGLLILILSSKVLVWGAVNIAHFYGISDLIIGLTIIAVGTSLPELAATVMGVWKGENEIAIGNIIGSNMFNLLAVMGIAGVIHPSVFEASVLSRDYFFMVAVTIALLLMAYGIRGPGRINRIEGALLVLSYAVYLSYLYLTVGN